MACAGTQARQPLQTEACQGRDAGAGNIRLFHAPPANAARRARLHQDLRGTHSSLHQQLFGNCLGLCILTHWVEQGLQEMITCALGSYSDKEDEEEEEEEEEYCTSSSSSSSSSPAAAVRPSKRRRVFRSSDEE